MFPVGRAGSMRAVTPGGGKIPQLNMSMVSQLLLGVLNLHNLTRTFRVFFIFMIS